ncbi:DUF4158 domain-containing protein (plasmid) [Clostridium estertheticum]|uniref:DUF4158 domain-containing protein n=1 Tax=Clostridium estertheticum TaxID=238834 RepID=UPI001C7D9390|nr:DUF4158 domain-containing protein [Clostridium estertheticum]WLC72875.1 DUF4158 domain-containing protein [Clostridium estertheticum]
MRFAIQLGTVEFLGAFSSEPANIPNNVSLYVTQQLNIDVVPESYKNTYPGSGGCSQASGVKYN